ncbi:hypothetical protein ABEZ21_31505 [Brevibacillus porteri]|uniref:IraD/Gp25-like domain-containing protein n=2 Tax=Brevibacillus porteri TaxID=2126350 RepID=A0ABX5FGI2_9BACL|nr:hypothetical protein [Brevibacillus porteri]MED2745766.1 hypothetical protein [Brevibacillus porteri]MED2813770.1 hypothetical protein [Brevibacillus porteri]MED4898775.1 hypothetical protein [Brevibacillus porteri]PSK01703.1 hypothetical protein C7R92_31305 [Brevibacillus porteri]
MTEYEVTTDQNPIDFGADGPHAIIQNIRMIMASPAYSCPMDRGFAWSPDVDSPLPIAQARTAARITEAIHTNEPRAEVVSVKFEGDGLEGLLKPRVKVRIRDGTI